MTLDAGIAELQNDADVLGARGDLLLFEPGTVGWDGASPHYDTEDGVTLVRVTLVRGRHPSTPLTPDVAQGYQVLARIGGGLFRIPAPGTPVMVGFPPMNAHAALTLKLAYDYLAELLPVSTLAHLKAQVRRAEEVLGRSSSVASWANKVRVFPRGLNLEPPRVDKAVLAVVYDSLLESRRLDVTYRMRGEKEDRTFEVNPLGLVVRGSLLTMVCTIGRKEDTRQLHLHRMRDARSTGRAAHVPSGFDLDTHIREGNLSFPFGSRVGLRARFAEVVVPTLEETPLSKDQRLTKELDGRAVLEATVPDTLELRAWLASYGPHVEVLAPPELRAQIGRQARETAALYASTDAT